jgi:nitroimidazol reductase NimA-like FMN-containing flavoprotein (pyridoxamine 5'-phosphate oxidase superfamily)
MKKTPGGYMRRKDREVADKQGLLRILQSNAVCRLGLAADNRPYVLPLNVGYTWGENEPLRLYFHCALEGQKLDMLAKNDLVCFEMDGDHKLLSGANACDYSFAYASIIGWGRIHFVTEAAEKRHALLRLMEQQAGPGAYAFSAADLARVMVLCLEAEEITGKRNEG